MICPNCGLENNDSDICSNCGEKLNDYEEIPIHRKQSKKKKLSIDNIKETTIKKTKSFVEDRIFNSDDHDLPQKDYDESLRYIKKHMKSKIEFPVDSDSKEKLSKLLAPEVVGGAGGLIGAAAALGILGTTLGAGLIVVSAGALISGLIAKNAEDIVWVSSEIIIWDSELVIAGKYSLHFDEIKHVGVEGNSQELVVITLKDKAVGFRTYNARALNDVINEKIDEYYGI